MSEGRLKREYVDSPLYRVRGMAVPQLVWVDMEAASSTPKTLQSPVETDVLTFGSKIHSCQQGLRACHWRLVFAKWISASIGKNSMILPTMDLGTMQPNRARPAVQVICREADLSTEILFSAWRSALHRVPRHAGPLTDWAQPQR